MANTKHEDAIMKMGFDYFRDNILKTLGIDYDFVEIGPTELVELTIHSLYMDFTFLTKNGIYIHIEFQTTDGKDEDLRRFHAYEAVYSHKTEKKVITYVIYSGGIKKTKAELNCGLYLYRVNPIYINVQDAEEVFRKLKIKRDADEPFTDEDFARLSLTPLMSRKTERKETIKEALLLAKSNKSITSQKSMAILYALADKFLEGADLDEIREVVSMTRIGQMLLDEGMKKGREQGREQGIDLAEKLLDAGRVEDLKRAVKDKEFREELIKEFQI